MNHCIVAPEFGDALVLRQGATIEDLVGLIHKDLKTQFKYALVWVLFYQLKERGPLQNTLHKKWD